MLLASAVAGESLPAELSGRAVAAVAYLVVFGSIVGFSAYVFLLGRVRPTVATSYAYVNPLIAIALGIGFGGERVELTEWLAMPVILAGVALVVLSHGKSRASHPGE